MGNIVHCRACGLEIDKRNVETWVMPTKNYYYHRKCLEERLENRQNEQLKPNDPIWLEYICEYLSRDLKIEYDYFMVKAQLDSFHKQGMTSKGVFFSLKYFYEVQHGDKTKSRGGIGIAKYVYEKATDYWVNKETKKRGVCAGIEKQLAQQRAEVGVHIAKRKKPKKVNLLDDI